MVMESKRKQEKKCETAMRCTGSPFQTPFHHLHVCRSVRAPSLRARIRRRGFPFFFFFCSARWNEAGGMRAGDGELRVVEAQTPPRRKLNIKKVKNEEGKTFLSPCSARTFASSFLAEDEISILFGVVVRHRIRAFTDQLRHHRFSSFDRSGMRADHGGGGDRTSGDGETGILHSTATPAFTVATLPRHSTSFL